VKNTTTLLSANEADGFTKMNVNVGRLGVNLDKFIFFQAAKVERALLLIDLEEDSSVFFFGVNNPFVLKAGDIFQRFVTADAQA
jgi:hypothetical protein